MHLIWPRLIPGLELASIQINKNSSHEGEVGYHAEGKGFTDKARTQ